MSENTNVGPAGTNKAAMSPTKPANHNTNATDGRTGDNSGSGADGSSASLTKVGPLKPVNP